MSWIKMLVRKLGYDSLKVIFIFIAELIVNMTATNKDNEWLELIKELVNDDETLPDRMEEDK